MLGISAKLKAGHRNMAHSVTDCTKGRPEPAASCCWLLAAFGGCLLGQPAGLFVSCLYCFYSRASLSTTRLMSMLCPRLAISSITRRTCAHRHGHKSDGLGSGNTQRRSPDGEQGRRPEGQLNKTETARRSGWRSGAVRRGSMRWPGPPLTSVRLKPMTAMSSITFSRGTLWVPPPRGPAAAGACNDAGKRPAGTGTDV